MKTINFNRKTFSLVENSKNGKANRETIFIYKQKGNLVTADYRGGSILYGKIIALLEGPQLNMLYQCITKQNEMRAGKAIAMVSMDDNGKLKLKLKWEWFGSKSETGISEFIEN